VKEKGGVYFKDYIKFASFGLGWCGIFIFIVVNILAALAQIAVSWLLSQWTKQDLAGQQENVYPNAFNASIWLFMLLAILRGGVVFWLCDASSTSMHNNMA
jgi:hypothetical protein